MNPRSVGPGGPVPVIATLWDSRTCESRSSWIAVGICDSYCVPFFSFPVTAPSGSMVAVETWSCSTAFRNEEYEYVTGGVAGSNRRRRSHSEMSAPTIGSHVRHQGGGGGAGACGRRSSGRPGFALLV